MGPLTGRTILLPAVARTEPVALGPSCLSTSHISGLLPPTLTTIAHPCQVPVTSTVTSVRSIQSGCVQPEAHIIVTATRIVPMVFTSLAPPFDGAGSAA